MTKVSFINIFLKLLHFVERLILALIVLSSRLKSRIFTRVYEWSSRDRDYQKIVELNTSMLIDIFFSDVESRYWLSKRFFKTLQRKKPNASYARACTGVSGHGLFKIIFETNSTFICCKCLAFSISSVPNKHSFLATFNDRRLMLIGDVTSQVTRI